MNITACLWGEKLNKDTDKADRLPHFHANILQIFHAESINNPHNPPIESQVLFYLVNSEKSSKKRALKKTFDCLHKLITAENYVVFMLRSYIFFSPKQKKIICTIIKKESPMTLLLTRYIRCVFLCYFFLLLFKK